MCDAVVNKGHFVINQNLMLHQNNEGGKTHTEVVDSPSLGTLEVRLDGILSNLI